MEKEEGAERKELIIVEVRWPKVRRIRRTATKGDRLVRIMRKTVLPMEWDRQAAELSFARETEEGVEKIQRTAYGMPQTATSALSGKQELVTGLLQMSTKAAQLLYWMIMAPSWSDGRAEVGELLRCRLVAERNGCGLDVQVTEKGLVLRHTPQEKVQNEADATGRQETEGDGTS